MPVPPAQEGRASDVTRPPTHVRCSDASVGRHMSALRQATTPCVRHAKQPLMSAALRPAPDTKRYTGISKGTYLYGHILTDISIRAYLKGHIYTDISKRTYLNGHIYTGISKRTYLYGHILVPSPH